MSRAQARRAIRMACAMHGRSSTDHGRKGMAGLVEQHPRAIVMRPSQTHGTGGVRQIRVARLLLSWTSSSKLDLERNRVDLVAIAANADRRRRAGAGRELGPTPDRLAGGGSHVPRPGPLALLGPGAADHGRAGPAPRADALPLASASRRRSCSTRCCSRTRRCAPSPGRSSSSCCARARGTRRARRRSCTSRARRSTSARAV